MGWASLVSVFVHESWLGLLGGRFADFIVSQVPILCMLRIKSSEMGLKGAVRLGRSPAQSWLEEAVSQGNELMPEDKIGFVEHTEKLIIKTRSPA